MAEPEDWTAADDAVVRRAMATLRSDVESVPLADVRFVKARGKARRRQRLLTWGAAAAAAVVVAGVGGYAALGTDRTPAPLPPQTSSTSGPARTTAAPYAALPTLADWHTDLGIAADHLTRVGNPQTVLCGVPVPTGFVEGYSVGSDAARPSGFALQFRPQGETGSQAAKVLAEAIERCRAPYTVLPHYRAPYGAAWVTGDIGSGYVGIASTKDAVALLFYTDPTLKGDPLKAGFGDLLDTAQKRLEADRSSGAPSSLDKPNLLPLAQEWQRSLDLPPGSVSVTQAGTLDGGVECGDALGKPSLQQSVVQQNSPVSAAATYWATNGDAHSTAALERGVAKCQAGPGFAVKSEYVGAFSLYSYSTRDAGSGWFAVVSGGQGVALLQLVDPAFNDVAQGGFTKEELGALAAIEQERLERYSATATTSRPTGPRAVDEPMPVSGPDPRPSSKLFVAASQWTSKELTGGARATAGPGALEGSTAIAVCESDQQQGAIGGSVGVVSVRAGSGSANYIGRQRVQVDTSTDPTTQRGYVNARLAEAKALYAKGCSFPNGTVKSTPGPSAGTWRLDTVFTDGSPTLSEWVGVTAQRTPGAVSTIVITKVADPEQGFAELDRLLELSRQK
jgi:hypothetical protein